MLTPCSSLLSLLAVIWQQAARSSAWQLVSTARRYLFLFIYCRSYCMYVCQLQVVYYNNMHHSSLLIQCSGSSEPRPVAAFICSYYLTSLDVAYHANVTTSQYYYTQIILLASYYLLIIYVYYLVVVASSLLVLRSSSSYYNVTHATTYVVPQSNNFPTLILVLLVVACICFTVATALYMWYCWESHPNILISR